MVGLDGFRGGCWLCRDLRNGRGLEVDGGGIGVVRSFGLGVFGVQFFEEELGGTLGLVGTGLDEFSGWGEEAVHGVMGDLGDDLSGWLGGMRFGQVEARDLEAVEEKAGAARVDFVGGDAAQDFADGVLDGGAVLWGGEGEAGLAALAGGGVLNGAAGVVVEVAETVGSFGAADGWAAAAAAVGEDVAALEAGGFDVSGDDFGCHAGGTPSPGFLRKI
jgi:hypothetical protein